MNFLIEHYSQSDIEANAQDKTTPLLKEIQNLKLHYIILPAEAGLAIFTSSTCSFIICTTKPNKLADHIEKREQKHTN